MYVQEEIEPYAMLDDAVEIVKSGGMGYNACIDEILKGENGNG